MSRAATILCLTSVCLFLAACGGGPEECNEVKRYQRAHEGARIVVPDGLDPLEPSKEMKIPDAPPPVPHAGGNGCLDRPPGTYSTGEG